MTDKETSVVSDLGRTELINPLKDILMRLKSKTDTAAKLEAIIKLYRETDARMLAISGRRRRKDDAYQRHEDLACEALCFVVAIGRLIDSKDEPQ